MSELRSSEVLVWTEHLPESGLSVASFGWPEGSAQETYRIKLDDFTIVELDAHVPVRPQSVTQLENADVNSSSSIAELFGNDLSQALASSQYLGTSLLTMSLSPENRATIASLQQASLETPELLRQVCASILPNFESSAKKPLRPRTRGHHATTMGRSTRQSLL